MSWFACCSSSSRSRRSEEHTSELQSHLNLVCRLLLEKKKRHNLAQALMPGDRAPPHPYRHAERSAPGFLSRAVCTPQAGEGVSSLFLNGTPAPLVLAP